MNKIKEARLKAGLTIKATAEALGIPQRTYESWEGGQRKPTDYVIRHLLDDIRKLGEQKMYKVRNTNKTFNTAFKALEEAVTVLNNKSNSAQLAWCGTDKEVFREVTGEEPTITLNEKSFILVDGDVFAIVQSDCTLEEANNALSDVADGVVIEEV